MGAGELRDSPFCGLEPTVRGAVPAVRTNTLAREQVLLHRDTVSPQESENSQEQEPLYLQFDFLTGYRWFSPSFSLAYEYIISYSMD
jgi:hypothetical protein